MKIQVLQVLLSEIPLKILWTCGIWTWTNADCLRTENERNASSERDILLRAWHSDTHLSIKKTELNWILALECRNLNVKYFVHIHIPRFTYIYRGSMWVLFSKKRFFKNLPISFLLSPNPCSSPSQISQPKPNQTFQSKPNPKNISVSRRFSKSLKIPFKKSYFTWNVQFHVNSEQMFHILNLRCY